MRLTHVTVFLAILFILLPPEGNTRTNQFRDSDRQASTFDHFPIRNVERNPSSSGEKPCCPMFVAQQIQMEKKGEAFFKPLYNIVIQNETDGVINAITVNYGSETFNIDQIEGQKFKIRNFVDYNVPETVIFQWQNALGQKYRKEIPVPEHQLEAYFQSTIIFSVEEGNEVSIEWQGHGVDTALLSDESKMKDAIKESKFQIQALIDIFAARGAYVTVDENFDDLCYQHVHPIDDSTCELLGEKGSKIRYYQTLDDIVDIILYSQNKVDKKVSPYNSKPLFTKKADVSGQIAILIVGELEVRVVAYDEDGKIIEEVNIKGN